MRLIDLLYCCEIQNIITKKTGKIFKKGDGPIDFDWNERYLVLDCENLLYFKTQFDKAPRGYIHLKDCFVSSLISEEVKQIPLRYL